MIGLISAFIIAMALSVTGTPLLIRFLVLHQYGQFIRQDGPTQHLTKRGTPTMGGVVIILATVIAWLIGSAVAGAGPSWSGLLLVFLFVGLGVIGLLVMSFLAPIASMLIQFSLSRTREFDADEDGAMLTQDPLALASALRKLEMTTDRRPMEDTPRTRNVAAMMIANPFRGESLMRMFSTHPPMDERIARLEKIAGY